MSLQLMCNLRFIHLSIKSHSYRVDSGSTLLELAATIVRWWTQEISDLLRTRKRLGHNYSLARRSLEASDADIQPGFYGRLATHTHVWVDFEDEARLAGCTYESGANFHYRQ